MMTMNGGVQEAMFFVPCPVLDDDGFRCEQEAGHDGAHLRPVRTPDGKIVSHRAWMMVQDLRK